MSNLVHNVEYMINRGAYFFSTLGTGSATLQVSIQGRAWENHREVTGVQNTNGVILLPECRVRAVLTGSADFVLELVANNR